MTKAKTMTHAQIRTLENAVARPDEPTHFMRLKPVHRRVTIKKGDAVVATTTRAIRLLEVGRDLYDPVFYIPKGDVTSALDPIQGKSTHCPLKGDASYWSHAGEEIAWSYDAPRDYADALRGLIAFDASKVSVTESPEED